MVAPNGKPGLLLPLAAALCLEAEASSIGRFKADLRKTGMSRGICVLLGCPSARDAVSLAETSGFLVYVQSSLPGEVKAVRRAAEAAGFLGKTIYVEQGPWRRIHLADNLADAINVAGAAPGTRGALRKELLRVLRPGGRAWLGKTEIVKPVPRGVDSWSHPGHGPDNNPQSADRIARAPYLTHFLAEPLFSSQPEVTVASGGRVFKAFGHRAFNAHQNAVLNTLYAFNGYNGTLLWTRKLKPGFMIQRDAFIATPDVLYLADDESCKLLDAATGRLLGEIVPPREIAGGTVWKWMALENGVLYALLGGKEIEALERRGGGTKIGGTWYEEWPGYDYKDLERGFGFGRAFLAIDPKTTRILWRRREEGPVDSRSLCMRNGRIYFYSPRRSLACLDAADGKLIWKSSDPGLLQAIGPERRCQYHHGGRGFAASTYTVCNDDVLFFAGPQRNNLVAVSTKDGELLWQQKDGNYQLLLREEALYASGVASRKLDYLTGRLLGRFPSRYGCARPTGSVDSIFLRLKGTCRLDPASNTIQHYTPMRPACLDGVIVSDGHLYLGPWTCGCALSLFGTVCLGPAGGFDFHRKVDESQQLERAPRATSRVKAFELEPGDWPTYLANNRRDGVTGVAVPQNVRLQWEFRPSSAVHPTAPVAAGGMVFVGGSDGVVRAMNAADGKEMWKSYTGGEVFFPPAIWQGRAYVGSNDGRVYAFEAATGRLLWRFRAAPTERKIPVYGKLSSTWPVAGGVVVEDGVLYAAAGIAHYDGTHVYALDAATGRTKWHNGTSGWLDPKVKNGISLCGSLWLSERQLHFPGGNTYPTASYDRSTGECPVKPVGVNRSGRVILFPRTAWEPLYEFDRTIKHGRVRISGNRVSFHASRTPEAARKNAPVWSKKIFSLCSGIAVALDTLLVLGYDVENHEPASFGLAAVGIEDGRELWSQRLPGMPVRWGVAVDGRGRVLVSLEDGRVLCFR